MTSPLSSKLKGVVYDRACMKIGLGTCSLPACQDMQLGHVTTWSGIIVTACVIMRRNAIIIMQQGKITINFNHICIDCNGAIINARIIKNVKREIG